MSINIKQKKDTFNLKDISNDGVIKNYKNSFEAINIKIDDEKHLQNQEFIKNKRYAEKIIDTKQVLIANDEKNSTQKSKSGKLANKNKSKSKSNNINDKTKISNNRYYISKKILKNTERAIDRLLIDDEDNLAINTIIKTKAGLKGSAVILKKNYDIGKKIGKKAYKVATSEKAKEVYNKTINTTQKGYEKVKEFSKKIYANKKENIKMNSLRQIQKKEIVKKARKKIKEQAESAVIIVASKIKNTLASLLTKKVVLVGLLIITLVVTLVSAVVGITTIFAYSVNLALDDNVTMISEYISELDTNINSQIDFAPQNYPYVDRFVYNVPQRAETNEEQVYAYLKAKYGDEKISETVIKGEIQQIHNNLYDLDFKERTRTWVETKEDGTTVTHSSTTMTITLTTKSFADYYEENKNDLLLEHQQKDYENILKMMKENVGKILNNPFPNIDWRKYVSSEYGYRIHPITEEVSLHTGLDIAMVQGTEIHSAMSGTVQTFNAGNTGFGLYVIVTNGKYKTLYAHCSEILVSNGEKINAGDVIAKVGSTGMSTGPHLHLEYFVNDIRKNPRAYLKIYEEE